MIRIEYIELSCCVESEEVDVSTKVMHKIHYVRFILTTAQSQNTNRRHPFSHHPNSDPPSFVEL